MFSNSIAKLCDNREEEKKNFDYLTPGNMKINWFE